MCVHVCSGFRLPAEERLLHVAVSLAADLIAALLLCGCGGRSLLPRHRTLYRGGPRAS